MRLLSKFSRIIAFVLTICLTSLSVSAQAIGGEQKTIVANSFIASGILNISDGTEVYINGNRAQDGMTVLSGAEVETREKGAIIALSNLGVVLICRQSKMNLLFENERVEVQLTSGNARLELNQGAGGEILTAAGGNLATDASGIAGTPDYSETNCGCKDSAAPVVPIAGLPGLLPILGIGGGAVIAALVGINLNDDDSPTPISVIVP